MIHAALLARGRRRHFPPWFAYFQLIAALSMLVFLIYSEHKRQLDRDRYRKACGYGFDHEKLNSPACNAYFKELMK